MSGQEANHPLTFGHHKGTGFHRSRPSSRRWQPGPPVRKTRPPATPASGRPFALGTARCADRRGPGAPAAPLGPVPAPALSMLRRENLRRCGRASNGPQRWAGATGPPGQGSPGVSRRGGDQSRRDPHRGPLQDLAHRRDGTAVGFLPEPRRPAQPEPVEDISEQMGRDLFPPIRRQQGLDGNA